MTSLFYGQYEGHRREDETVTHYILPSFVFFAGRVKKVEK